MNLKNYTSKVSAQITIANIEAVLMAIGASAIAKEIKNGQVSAIMFQIECEGNMRTIRISANVEAVQDYLWSEFAANARRNLRTRDDFKEQAQRTAWRIMHDWAQVQISLIKLKQADAAEVFLAFMWDGQQTYYEFLKGNKFKALPERCP